MNKYRNRVTVVDGIRFDSLKEARRWTELKIAEKAQVIRDLERQVSYPLIVNEIKIGVYRCDFRYVQDGICIVEDAKGILTPVYRLKKKLMKAWAEYEKVRAPAFWKIFAIKENRIMAWR